MALWDAGSAADSLWTGFNSLFKCSPGSWCYNWAGRLERTVANSAVDLLPGTSVPGIKTPPAPSAPSTRDQMTGGAWTPDTKDAADRQAWTDWAVDPYGEPNDETNDSGTAHLTIALALAAVAVVGYKAVKAASRRL